jgi:hypothetical protein
MLVSPGVEVTVIDESAYGSPGSGTIPLIVLATSQDKTDPTNSSADGIAYYTKAAQAGRMVKVTSQREITQYFGSPIFTTNSADVVIQGSETSEYGLMAAYSYLGQGNQAFIVRADLDLQQLNNSDSEPVGVFNTDQSIWLDTDASSYGIHEYNATSGLWVNNIPLVEINADATTAEAEGNISGAPAVYTPSTTVVDGSYLVVIHAEQADLFTLEYYKGVGTSWEIMDSSAAMSDGTTVTYARHFTVPTSPSDGDVWIKTTSPSNGIDLAISVYTVGYDYFIPQVVQGVNITHAVTTDITDYYPQDGSSNTALTTDTAEYNNFVLNTTDNTSATVRIYRIDVQGTIDDLTAYHKEVGEEVPVALPVDGQLWFNDTVDELDVYMIVAGDYIPVDVTYQTEAPNNPSNGDVWCDTSNAGMGMSEERTYPVLKVYQSGLGWITHSNTDQTTARGVLFASISDTYADDTNSGAATVLSEAPDAIVYPDGMLAVNMGQSKNTVRVWVEEAAAWRNAVANHADGSGRFGRYAQRAYIATKMQAAISTDEIREPHYKFSLITAPGYPELTDELVNLNADRHETAFIILGAPMRMNPTQAVNWVQNVNVAAENGEDGLVTHYTYSAVYYPSAMTTDPTTGQSVVVPPEHVALYTYAYSDNVSFQWFPPAGLTRGMVFNATSVGYITSENEYRALALSNGQRDSMYMNNLNPITTFIGRGTFVFGQKTLHPYASALDRVNVARLIVYLRDRFDEIALPFLFELNDAQTRERAKIVFERFLADILSRRGIYDFAVVCDESNNTPARIDRNELYIDVAIEPAKAIEFIYIPIRVVNTGTLSNVS